MLEEADGAGQTINGLCLSLKSRMGGEGYDVNRLIFRNVSFTAE